MPARSRRRVYLSGGMEYARGEGADWRQAMEAWLMEALSESVFNPNVQSSLFLARRGFTKASFRAMKAGNPARYQRLVSRIVDKDSQEIVNNTSYVICKWDRSAQKGAGTKGEITVARLVGKPVYLVTSIDSTRIPGWVLGCATRMFLSFADLKLFLKNKHARKQRGIHITIKKN